MGCTKVAAGHDKDDCVRQISSGVMANMDAADLNEIGRLCAVGAGVIIGSAAILAAIFIWLRKQVFAYGGSALCVSGMVLIGLSIWQTVDVAVGPNGLDFKAAEAIVQSAADAATKANAVAQTTQAAVTQSSSLADTPSKAAIVKANQDAQSAAAAAKGHFIDITKDLTAIYGNGVCGGRCVVVD